MSLLFDLLSLSIVFLDLGSYYMLLFQQFVLSLLVDLLSLSLVFLVLGSYQVVLQFVLLSLLFGLLSLSTVFLFLGSFYVVVLVVCSFVPLSLLFGLLFLQSILFQILTRLFFQCSVLRLRFLVFFHSSSVTLVPPVQSFLFQVLTRLLFQRSVLRSILLVLFLSLFGLSYSRFLLVYSFSDLFFCLSYRSSFFLSLIFLILGSYQVIILQVYSFVSGIWSSFSLLCSKFSPYCFVSDLLQLVVNFLLGFHQVSDS